MLGKAHAMDEKEERAMAAFEAGRKELQTTSSASNIGAGELLTVSSTHLVWFGDRCS